MGIDKELKKICEYFEKLSKEIMLCTVTERYMFFYNGNINVTIQLWDGRYSIRILFYDDEFGRVITGSVKGIDWITWFIDRELEGHGYAKT